MHSLLKDLLHLPVNWLWSYFDVRPEERHTTGLLLIHSCFVGISMAFFFTPANALFLSEFGTDLIPHGYMLAAVAGTVIGIACFRMDRTLSFSTTLIANLSILLGAVLAFWMGLLWVRSSWLPLGLYILITPFISLINIEFWGLTGRLLNLRQAKRLYGLIGAGEVVTSLLAFFTIPLIVNHIGTINLLLIAAGGLLCCLILLIHINRRYLSRNSSPPKTGSRGRSMAVQGMRSPKSRYLRLILNVMILSTLGLYFLHYFFLDQAYAHYPDANRLAAFFGFFYGTVKLFELLLRFIVSGRLLSRYGLKAGLVLIPGFLIVGVLATAIVGTFMGIGSSFFYLVVATKLMDRTGRLSIFDPTFRVLYQPLKPDDRISFQTRLEGIYQPLVSGVAGGILFFMTQVQTFTLVHFSYFLTFLMLAWIIQSLWLSREYPTALKQAITKRILNGEHANLSLTDASSLDVLKRSLNSSNPGEVIFSLDLMGKDSVGPVEPVYRQLLEHPSPLVRINILERIEGSPSPGMCDAVTAIIGSDDSADVRGKALRALCTFDDTGAVKMVSSYLSHPDHRLRKNALLGLLQHPETGRTEMAEKALLEMAESGSVEDRKSAAWVLGEAKMKSSNEILLRLLRDETPLVRCMAASTAGKIGDPHYCAPLMEILTIRSLCGHARSALAAIGVPTLPYLKQSFTLAGVSILTRIQILRIVGRIGGSPGLKFLLAQMDFPNQSIRAHILDELKNCGYKAPNGDIYALWNPIEREAASVAWKLSVKKDLGGHEATDALSAALDGEIRRHRYNIFLLLSFIHTPETILKAHDAISQGTPEKKSYAYELIDVVIAPEIKTILFPLCRSIDSGRPTGGLMDRFPQETNSRSTRLEQILKQSEADILPLTKALAIHAVAELQESGMIGELESNLKNEHGIVRETAAWAISIIHPQKSALINHQSPEDWKKSFEGAVYRRHKKPTGESEMFLTLEKVMLLKTVEIFQTLSEETLTDIAAHLVEVPYESGETVITKGEVGDCMYIVAMGGVRVHDGDRTIAELGVKEIVGEMALLDAEPRMASVTALEDATLLRLDQDVFYELMSDFVDVSRGIISVLVQRLRSKLEAT